MTTTLNASPSTSTEISTERYAYDRCNEILMAYGLYETAVVMVNAKRRAGAFVWLVDPSAVTVGNVLRFKRNEIRISRAYASGATRAQVDDMIIHEVAHAIVELDECRRAHRAGRDPVSPGHGPVWQRQYRQMGGTGGRTVEAHEVPETMKRENTAKWVGTCQTTDADPCVYHRHTLTARSRNGTCVKHSRSITWTMRG